jgi:ketosteroid isomerase-like protein
MNTRWIAFAAGALALPACLAAGAAAPAERPTPSVEAFNEAMSDATRRMDNAATVALWEDDAVSLLPDTPPITGKKAFAQFLDDVTRGMPEAHMERFEMSCTGIDLRGDLATEWCLEHQKIGFAGGKPPFEGWGHLLLVLHRGSDGNWKLRREMWNSALPPASAAKPQ